MTNLKLGFYASLLLLLGGCGSGDNSLQDLISKAEDKLFCDDKLTLAPFAAGDGSSLDPYRICTIEQFNQIADKIASDNAYNTKSYALYADLDYQNKTYTMIGDATTGFMGILDGRNYGLSNILLNVATDYTGVFRRIDVAGVVKNLIIKDASITAKNYTGILAGYSGGKVESIKTTGVVIGTVNVGGIIGRLWTADNTKGVFSSSSSASVTGTGSWVGGVVGWSRNASIQDSFATGNVRGAERVGGLLGVGDGGILIKKSYATGNVSATSATGLNGGLVGGMSGTIESSYSTGNVSSPASGYVGGIAGTFTGTLTKSYSTSKVTASVYVNGGLVGYMYAGGSISNCYFNGEINSPTDYVGGLVGYNAGSPITYSFVASSSITANDPGALNGGTALAAAATSFWDAELSGIPSDFIDDMTTKVTANGLTTSDMKTKATFINAAYSEAVWNIPGGSYPTLK